MTSFDLIIFASFASLVTWFSTVRSRIEGELHDTIFVVIYDW